MTTTKYDLSTFPFGLSDWGTALTTNMTAVDTHLHTRLQGTMGETFAIGEPGYLHTDGKWYKAKAGKGKVVLGLAIETGVLNDSKRFQRVGPFTKAGWTWSVGVPVWLSPDTAGALTQTRPSNPAKRQMIGVPSAATTIVLNIVPDADTLLTTTSTTTSSTTSTSSTTTSSSTSSSSSSSTSSTSSTASTTSTSSSTTTTS